MSTHTARPLPPARAFLSTACLLAALPAAPALAQTTWTAADGDWSVDANWSAGTPSLTSVFIADPNGDGDDSDAMDFLTATDAEISNGGTIRVTQPGQVVDVLRVGALPTGSGSVVVDAGGELTVNADGVAAQGLYLGDEGPTAAAASRSTAARSTSSAAAARTPTAPTPAAPAAT